MKIRTMEVADLGQVMPIENALFSVPWSEVGFFSFLMREDALFLVAEEKGEIIGYCGVLMALDEGDVLNVGVKPERQGQGIGRMLVDALVKKAGSKGVDSLYLEVRASNQAAIHLYESLGFCRMGVRKGYYEEPREDGITMYRDSARCQK